MSYQEVSRIESVGKYTVGVSISIAISRELTQAEKNEISMITSKLNASLVNTSYTLDPKTLAAVAQEKIDISNLFSDHKIYVKEIPNQYDSTSPFPWFSVTTTKGIIIIGWRKRVLHIDYSGVNDCITAINLFPDEDVTKEGATIHAWGYKKAAEYLQRILRGSEPVSILSKVDAAIEHCFMLGVTPSVIMLTSDDYKALTTDFAKRVGEKGSVDLAFYKNIEVSTKLPKGPIHPFFTKSYIASAHIMQDQTYHDIGRAFALDTLKEFNGFYLNTK